jgi:hypothetical protein
MKKFVNNRIQVGVMSAMLAFLWLGTVIATAAPAEVYHKKDGAQIIITSWMGGAAATGFPVYFWIEYVPNTVVKVQEDGTYWIHDCANEATVTIGTNPEYMDSTKDPEGAPSKVFYRGSGSIILAGFYSDPGTGWLVVGDKMNYQIKATVAEVDENGLETGQLWKLFWHAVERKGEWSDTFRFEPVK